MNKKPLILIGAGGHAASLAEILLEQKREIIAVVAPSLTDSGSNILSSFTHYTEDEKILEFDANKVELINGVGAMPKSGLREKIHIRFTQAGFTFSKVVANSAFVSPRAKIGDGVQVMRNATICLGSIIGENTIVNTRASIDHDCIVGKHCHIAPGVTMSGNVTLGDNVHIATGASIINGIQIGKRTVIGVGASVTKSIKENCIVYGAKAMIREQV